MDQCKEGEAIMNTYITFALLAVLCVGLVTPIYAQEKTGSLDVYIKNEKNERVTPEGITIKIFKNQEKTPIQEITSLQSNPFNLSLPLGHRYGIEVYVNSLYADTAFVDLQKNQSIEIPIKNAGGLLLNVYYKDGETPLPGAKVWIKSQDGKWWSYSETAQNGQTIRTWLYPTTKEGYYYSAEISLGTNLKHIHTPIKLEAGIAQDLKIITKWPVVVDKLFPVEVYNDTKNKVTKQDGAFLVQLFDSKKKKVAEAEVTAKGVANLSKLKVGNYALYVKEKDGGQLKTVAGKKITITEDTGITKIYLNNPELNSDYLNCNCVAFRLDDVQDYFLAPSQIELISLFDKKDAPFTIGIIGGLIGTDPKLIESIKGGLAADPPIEIASHSWNNHILSKLTKKEQEQLIQKANEKINSVFGVTPTVFIPPENLFNNDTISVLKSNGFTHISYATTTREPPIFKKSSFYEFPIVPYTAILDPSAGLWKHVSNDQIMEKIEESIFDYGYAVVMMHPYEFAAYENGFYVNKVNATKIQELGTLIDKVRENNHRILAIGSIQDYDKPQISKPTPTPTVTPEKPNCNCVAFRMDNFQDFWLNDVQNTVIDTFDKNKTPLTISVIGKFTGDDPKTIDYLKSKLNKTSNIKIANRGWEYVDHTTFDKQKQTASITQTNEKIAKVFGKKATIFSPPYDAFNKDTLDAASQARLAYFSAGMPNDKLSSDGTLKHVPSTLSFLNLVSDDPFVTGNIQQKAFTKTESSIKQHGYALISLQSSDFAVKTDGFKNEVNQEKIQQLISLISDIKASNMKIVLLEQIPSLVDDGMIVVPDWIKNNAKWWSEGKIGNGDFVKGLQYLIQNGIIAV